MSGYLGVMPPFYPGQRLQPFLSFPDDGPHLSCGEEPWTKRAGRVLADARKRAKRIAHGRRHVIELPADLFFGSPRPVRVRKGDSLDRVRSRAQTVGVHVADRYCLSGSARRGRRSGTACVVHADTADETSPDLSNRREFTVRKGACALDELSWAVVSGMLGLEHVEDPLCAVGGPPGDLSPIAVA
jgi:hypothetical protein